MLLIGFEINLEAGRGTLQIDAVIFSDILCKQTDGDSDGQPENRCSQQRRSLCDKTLSVSLPPLFLYLSILHFGSNKPSPSTTLSLSNPECRCRTPPPSRSQTEPGCQSELCICTYMKIYIYLIVLIIPRKRVKLGLVHTPH